MAESLRERLSAQQETAVLAGLRRAFSRNEYETKACFRGNEPEADKVPEQSACLCTRLDLCETLHVSALLRPSAPPGKPIWATGRLVMRHNPDAPHFIRAEMKTRAHTPLRDTGITFIMGDLCAAASASTGSGVQLPRRRAKVHPGTSFQGTCNPSGSRPGRRAAGIHAAVYCAAKQSGVSIKTFDRNSQISCCTWSVFQTTAGGSRMQRRSRPQPFFYLLLSKAMGRQSN